MNILKVIPVLAIFLLSTSFINAQDKSIEEMMQNNQTRGQVISYIVNHHDVMQQFMDKAMNDENATNSMMDYMMGNKNSRMIMMNHVFLKANKDKNFYEEMHDYMNNYGEYMNMMQGMMNQEIHPGSMKHSGMMNNNKQ